MKKVLITLIIFSFLLAACTNPKKDNSKNLIVATSYPCFDFARALVKGTTIDVEMLLNPGEDLHEYDPTPKDIIDIEDSKLFIYVGGESDDWVKGVLSTIDKNSSDTFKMIDSVKSVKEESKEGMETQSDGDVDEHVWTSPANAMKIIDDLKEVLIEKFPDETGLIKKNAEEYIGEIKKVDLEIKDIVKNSDIKTLVFGDRFPILYFTLEYGLDYYAAFPGCAHETEASAKTISFLIDKVKKKNIPAVLKTELSNGSIAKTISKETNTKVLTFETAHNVTKKDFDDGVTYVNLMKRNITVLKEALYR